MSAAAILERRPAHPITWDQAVAALADGREPAADALGFLLAETGRTAEDLDQAAARARGRRALRAELAGAEALEAERETLRAELAAAGRELARARRDHEALVAARLPRLRELEALIPQRRQALEARLRHTAPAELHARDAAIGRELLALGRRLETLRDTAAKVEVAAAQQRRVADGTPGGPTQLAHLADARRTADRAAGYREQVAAAERRIDQLRRERDDLARRMLDA